jgi:hypothetical protein
LASSDIDPHVPWASSFSFDELMKIMYRSESIRIFTVLDCCYSGAAKIGKGHEENAVTAIIDDRAKVLEQRVGKCLLVATQEDYAPTEQGHGI